MNTNPSQFSLVSTCSILTIACVGSDNDTKIKQVFIILGFMNYGDCNYGNLSYS